MACHYDLQDPAAATSQHYKALTAQASDPDRHFINHLATIDGRIHGSYSITVNPQTSPNLFPGKLAEMLVKPKLEDEFNRWYKEEHIPDIARVPGWYRTRRYKLIGSIEPKGTNEGPVHNYLAIHEWSHDTYRDTPEYAALTTSWTTKMLKEVTAVNTRRFLKRWAKAFE